MQSFALNEILVKFYCLLLLEATIFLARRDGSFAIKVEEKILQKISHIKRLCNLL